MHQDTEPTIKDRLDAAILDAVSGMKGDDADKAANALLEITKIGLTQLLRIAEAGERTAAALERLAVAFEHQDH